MRACWGIACVVLALAATLFPARADVPVTGSFLAANACPALQSFNKGTNPGDVTLAPEQRYQVVAANKTPASHYLLVVPGARPERRWVPIDCGTLEGAAQPAPKTTAEGTGTKASNSTAPTHYVLSLSWEPGFCAGHDGKPECRAETPASFDASHFTLHGLWPDPREYCGAAAADISADKAGHWDQLPAVTLSAGTRSQLAEAMPGTQSLLERHEWIKHGTCSTLSADAYFSRALAFVDAVNTSPVQALLVSRIGADLTLADLRTASDKSFGPGAGQRIRLSCPRQDGVRTFTELTIGLEGDISTTPLPRLIAAAKPTTGGCDSATVPAVQ